MSRNNETLCHERRRTCIDVIEQSSRWSAALTEPREPAIAVPQTGSVTVSPKGQPSGGGWYGEVVEGCPRSHRPISGQGLEPVRDTDGKRTDSEQSFNQGTTHYGCSAMVLEKLGGRTRARTWDPLIKSQLLYQLSYAPGARSGKAFARAGRLAKRFGDVQQGSAVFPIPTLEASYGKTAGFRRPSQSPAGFRVALAISVAPAIRDVQARPRPAVLSGPWSRSMPRSIQRCRRPPPSKRRSQWVSTTSRRFWGSSSVL